MTDAHKDRHRGRQGKPPTRAERRDQEAPRLAYEALVEVGSRSLGGFEAESVDVSLDGIRIRTAYLPQPGENIVCRFDGLDGEIVVKGEVIWCNNERRGGEFGVRFTGLGPDALSRLEDLCGPEDDALEGDADPSLPDGAAPGARVRLHMQGLGSPMRARVREAARGEVLVGSNLEFLTVGRNVELEDVERGERRIAHIEHVGVDLDPETQVPQLVVALTYELSGESATAIEDEDLTTAPIRVQRAVEPKPATKPAAKLASKAAATVATGRASVTDETTPEPSVIDKSVEVAEEPESYSPTGASMSGGAGRVAYVPAPTVREATAPPTEDLDDQHEDDEPQDEVPMRPAVHQRVGAFAKKLAPKLTGARAGAKVAFGKMGGVLNRVQEKRAEAATRKAKKTPKRTTAPPPSGALRSQGKRLVRERLAPALRKQSKRSPGVDDAPESEAHEEVAEAPRNDRKRAIFGAVIGVLAVLAIYFVSSRLKGEAPEATADATTTAAPAAATPAASQGQGAVATANVPLFGATPMSTMEPVPAPPAPGEAAGAGPGGGDEAPPEAGNDEGAKPDTAKFGKLEAEWGVGEVNEPTVFRFKFDGKLEGITGSETANGFTITVPAHKSVSSAAGMSRRDKRLRDVNVVNYPDRAEITFAFKKEVPAFVARTRGKRLIIDIATKKKKSKKKKKSRKKKKKK